MNNVFGETIISQEDTRAVEEMIVQLGSDAVGKDTLYSLESDENIRACCETVKELWAVELSVEQFREMYERLTAPKDGLSLKATAILGCLVLVAAAGGGMVAIDAYSASKLEGVASGKRVTPKVSGSHIGNKRYSHWRKKSDSQTLGRLFFLRSLFGGNQYYVSPYSPDYGRYSSYRSSSRSSYSRSRSRYGSRSGGTQYYGRYSSYRSSSHNSSRSRR
jgi:hypothetical protein